ncbi:pentapeptide repeat-containing protein [Pedobacter sp. N36a]|uniref:pentapeptide repeat-containing protein n=1 Tax=Pedobacter sp. N36a TaxID=2767996 RepID=UPI0016575BA2|nr:pentapeptide repeat-containing protein [Pedobacter sp. N36a]MBC8986690.1 pentapeptide repeat-containing protein [Pedobacter sp. N36a]
MKGEIYKDFQGNTIITAYEDCIFENSTFDSTFDFEQISKSKFINCGFNKINFGKEEFKECTFENTEFRNCRFMFSNLSNSRFVNCVFTDGNFISAKFVNSILFQVVFKNCQLRIKSFENASLTNVDFSNHKLQSVCFNLASFVRVNFTKSHIYNCLFQNTKSSECIFTNSAVSNLGENYEFLSLISDNQLENVLFNKLDSLRIRFFKLSEKLKLLSSESNPTLLSDFLLQIQLDKQKRIVFMHFNKDCRINEDWEPDEMTNAYLELTHEVGTLIFDLIGISDTKILEAGILKITTNIDTLEIRVNKFLEERLFRPFVGDDFGIDEEEQIMRALKNGEGDAFGF